MKTAIVYSAALIMVITLFSSCYVLEMSRKKNQCELFVIYEEDDYKKRTVVWEDSHCGPGTGLTRMMRRNRKRKLEEANPTKTYSIFQYNYVEGQELIFDESSNTYVRIQE